MAVASLPGGFEGRAGLRNDAMAGAASAGDELGVGVGGRRADAPRVSVALPGEAPHHQASSRGEGERVDIPLVDSLSSAILPSHATSSLSFELRYAVTSALSLCANLLPSPFLPPSFWRSLHNMPNDAARWALLHLPIHLRRFDSVTDALKRSLAAAPLPPWGPTPVPIPRGHVAVPRVVVTPTRVVFLPPQPVPSNYVIRNFRVMGDSKGETGRGKGREGESRQQDGMGESEDGGYDRSDGDSVPELQTLRPSDLMIVLFRDEDGQLISGQKELLPRVRQALVSGIHVAGRRFTFLAASGSQLRTHACWMTAVHRSRVWEWLGDLSSIR